MSAFRLGRAASLIRRLTSKPAMERRLLVRAAVAQAVVIAAIRCGRGIPWIVAHLPVARRREDGDAVGRAVVASSVVFGTASTCLSRAIAMQALLRHDAAVLTVIGVRRAGDDRALDAHAWVERDGRALLGALAGDPHRALAGLQGGRWRRV